MSDNAAQVEAELVEAMKLIFVKCMGFYPPAAKRRLAECLFGQAVVSTALQSVSAEPHLPSVKVLACSSHRVIGRLSGDGRTIFELLQAGLSWTKEYTPPKFFNLLGLRDDGEYYLLPYNVQLTELPDEVILVAVESENDSKQLMLAAVTHDWRNLKDASDLLKADREVAIAGARQSTFVFNWLSHDLKEDKEVVLAAAEQNGFVLEIVSEALSADRDVVLCAVAQDGDALMYASEELQNDNEILDAAGL